MVDLTFFLAEKTRVLAGRWGEIFVFFSGGLGWGKKKLRPEGGGGDMCGGNHFAVRHHYNFFFLPKLSLLFLFVCELCSASYYRVHIKNSIFIVKISVKMCGYFF